MVIVKHPPHLIFIGLAMVCGLVIAFPLINTVFSEKMSALMPRSVGNKAAPVPVLVVDNVIITAKKSLSSSQIKSSLSSSIGNAKATPKYTLKEYQLQWNVSVEDGTLAKVSAQVFVPEAPLTNRGQQFPLIVYGAGTTGLADRCAPSLENLARGNMGNYRNYMVSEASQGYVVVMPNYEGFDNNRDQHYFNKDNEARTMLSAGKAMVLIAQSNNIPIKPGTFFIGGYSQGGHAAFSAADYATQYVPDLKVSGVFGHGPTTDIPEYLESNPNLAAYFVESYSKYYPAFDPKIILTPKWIGYLPNAERVCVDEGFGINSTTVDAVFAEPFKSALKNKTIARDFPAINDIFTENKAGTSYTDIPTMIVQGTTDPVVTEEDQQAFISLLCRRGVSVDLIEYKGVHHFYTRQVSFFDTNAWIDAISQGQTVKNSCVGR